jgi:hypothetical protein
VEFDALEKAKTRKDTKEHEGKSKPHNYRFLGSGLISKTTAAFREEKRPRN